jgi:hypothetical protein
MLEIFEVPEVIHYQNGDNLAVGHLAGAITAALAVTGQFFEVFDFFAEFFAKFVCKTEYL